MSQLPINNDEKPPTHQGNSPSKPITAEHSISNASKENNTIINSSEDKAHHKKKINWPSWITAICTVFIVIITGFYTYYAREQVAQMRETVNIANDTAIRQLRAYINVDHVNINNVANPLPSQITARYKPTGAEITDPTTGPIITIQFRNSGQTPAYNLKMWGEIFIDKYPLPSALPKELQTAEPGTKTTISSQGTPLFYLHLDKPLTEGQTRALRDGTIAIYAYGEITYTDIFGKSHNTNFLGMHGPKNKTIGISTLVAICDEGNEAD